tara:strand:- start:51 stop:230 length:180 start_codon:yes stop_codon:yes gene_type:complete
MTVQLQPIEENGFQHIEELNTNGERFNFYDYMMSGDTWYGEMIINCKGKQTTMDWEMTD